VSSPAAAKTHDDGTRDYPYPPTGESFPSVTTVLGATEAKPWLPAWSAGIAAEYAVDNLAALARLKRTEGRDKAVALAKKQAALIRDRKRDTGGYVHDMAEALVLWQASPEGRGTDLSLPLLPGHLQGADYDGESVDDVAGWMVEGYLNWVADYGPQFLAAEMTVYNALLKVAGTLDQIVRLPGLGTGRAGRFVHGPGLDCCVDLKTGKHLDATVPEQIALYRRMREARMPLGDLVPMPPTDCGAVLHLRPEYERGYRFILISGEDDEAAWNRARRAIELHAGRKAAKAKPGKVCYPPRADGTFPQPRIADLDGEGYGRVLAPLAKAGIRDLEQLAAMTAGQLLKTKGIGGKTVDGVRVMLADHGLCLKGEELAPVPAAVRETAREAALWPSSTSSAGASRSAGSAWASRSAPASSARTAGRRCGPSGGKPGASPPAPATRPTPPPNATAARSARGTGSGTWTRNCRRSPSRCRPATRSSPSTTRCGPRAAAPGAATRSTSRSPAARACARTRKTRPTRRKRHGRHCAGPAWRGRTRRRHAT
jgi:hypothetical protein